MEKSIQLIQLTPQQLQSSIIEGINQKFDELKTSFQPKEPTELLTRAETSSLLKINLTTLWNWTKQGRIISYGIGNRVYYKRSEIMEAIIKLNN